MTSLNFVFLFLLDIVAMKEEYKIIFIISVFAVSSTIYSKDLLYDI